jgi:hypothetical protein
MVNWARVHRERDTHAIEVQIVDVRTTHESDATTCRQCTLITVEVLIDMILVLEVLVDSITLTKYRSIRETVSKS